MKKVQNSYFEMMYYFDVVKYYVFFLCVALTPKVLKRLKMRTGEAEVVGRL